MQLFLTVTLLLCSLMVTAQIDTIYYGEYREKVKKENAVVFGVFKQTTDGTFNEARFNMDGSPTGKYHYLADMETLDGPCTLYYRNGKTEAEYSYILGKMYGPFKKYYNNGQLWLQCNYENGRLVGELKSYYENGKLKRQALYANDELGRGAKYDTNGKEIPFTPFMKPPEAPYDVSQFLGSKIHYPNKARYFNIEGRVEISFLVDKKGFIIRPAIRKSANRWLDKEAYRVVTKMPPWQPGMEDDEPAEVPFTLPVIFRLEN